MHVITLFPPAIESHRVRFRWSVLPRTTLYHNEEFSLHFPETIDLSRVPHGIWWMIALTSLHSQWALLRPCRVKLPFKLRAGEAETWLRLIDSYISTLEAYRSTKDVDRSIVIEDRGPLLEISPVSAENRFGTAFSGGKDSLLQVGLLSELTSNPLLVATTSPMPSLADHLTARRRQVLREIERRRNVTLVEVESDYRANFDHGFAQNMGYQISVNELTDTFLYLSALVAVGAAVGVNHLCLASEIQVNETVEFEGRGVQHPHFMYSTITLGVLSAIFSSWGITISSLTCPLHSFHVQKLLWTRYADLRDLQYSCWRVKLNESMCNACTQCLRVALSALAINDDPRLIGADLVKLLNATRSWAPRAVKPDPQLPSETSSYQLQAHVMRAVQQIPLSKMIQAIAPEPSRFKLLKPSVRSAIRSYRELEQKARDYAPGPEPGYRAGNGRFVDPILREAIDRIYAEHFRADEEASYAEGLARSEAMMNWITQPLRFGAST